VRPRRARNAYTRSPFRSSDIDRGPLQPEHRVNGRIPNLDDVARANVGLRTDHPKNARFDSDFPDDFEIEKIAT